MLRMVARDSVRARATPARSPLTSVTPALCMATSVPVPIATPTSASASAGASLTPSPAMATARPSPRRRRTIACFCSGRTSASTSLMPGAIVAGQHDDADAVGFKARAMDSEILQEFGIADGDLALTDFSGDAFARHRPEFAHGVDLHSALFRNSDNRSSKRMFARLLQTRTERQDRVFV